MIFSLFKKKPKLPKKTASNKQAVTAKSNPKKQEKKKSSKLKKLQEKAQPAIEQTKNQTDFIRVVAADQPDKTLALITEWLNEETKKKRH